MAINSGFDYSSVFGSNPWNKPAKQISNLVSRMFSAIQDSRKPAGSGTAAASFGSWSLKPASAEDPGVQDYMSHLLGGQRSQLQDYVRQAAGAGIRRSGLNVKGGADAASSLHLAAMKNLASGYSDRFREAMNYNKALKESQYNVYSDRIRNLQNLLGLQQSYLTGQADWRNRLGTLKHSDWRSDREFQRQAPFRQLQLDSLQRQAKMDRFRNFAERQQREMDYQRAVNTERKYGLYQSMSDTHSMIPRTPGEITDFQRALIELGLKTPFR